MLDEDGGNIYALAKLNYTCDFPSLNLMTPYSGDIPPNSQYPVSVSINDIGMTGPDTLRSRRIWEVMDNVTTVNTAAIEFLVVVNEKVFQSLTEGERTIITTAAKKAESTLRSEFAQIEKDAIEAGRQNKMTVYTPTAAEMDDWRKSAVPVRDEFLKGSGPLGKQVYEAALGLK